MPIPPRSRKPARSAPAAVASPGAAGSKHRIGLAEFYNAVQGRRGFALAPHHYPLIAGLEDDRIHSLLTLISAGAGKSNVLDIIYPTWRLGHDPTLAILSISAGERLPQTFLQASMQIVQDDPTFRRCFPEVRPDPGAGWSLERGMYVTGRHDGDENPSYFCAGLASKALTGLHAREIIFDDIHDEENARTPEARAEVVSRYYRTLVGRADPRGCRRIAVGRWWAQDDLYQEWMQSGEWVVMQLPATRPGQRRLWYDVDVPLDEATGEPMACVFSETGERSPEDEQPGNGRIRYRVYYAAIDSTEQGFYWPGSPMQRRNYQAIKRRQPRIAAVNYDGDMTGGGEGVFRETDFRPYIPPVPPEELARGIQSPEVRRWTHRMKGAIEEAWDTALGQPKSGSLTTALTGLLVPCREWHCGEDPALVGPCDFHYDVWLLDLMARSLDFRELALALRQRHGLWHPRRVIVEEKISGISLLQTFRGTQIPVHGQKVVQGKLERAINPVMAPDGGQPIPGGAASVQGWGRMGRILVPEGVPWLHDAHGDASQGFLKRVCAFTGGTRASDEVDALVHLVTRAILLSRQTAYVPGTGNPTDPALMAEPAPFGQEDLRQAHMEAFQMIAGQGAAVAAGHLHQIENPFEGSCGAPCHWYGVVDNAERCRHPQHQRKVSALHGCLDWAKWGTVKEDTATGLVSSVAG